MNSVLEIRDIDAHIATEEVDGKIYRLILYPDFSKDNWKEYFIIIDSLFIWEAKKISRISIRSPEYIFTIPETEYRENWILDINERRILTEILTHDRWKDLIESFNNSYAFYDRRWEFGITKNNLISNGLKYPKALPYDLPMPNYMLLPE